MRWLITGASGYLGRRLSKLAEGRAQVLAGYARHPDRLQCGDPVQLDLTTDIEPLVKKLQPDAILHTAAINPGGDETLMEAVNVEGSRRLAEAARQTGARLIHVSTDVVHDGRRAPYPEDATPEPHGSYAQTKARAESVIRTACPSAAIVRTSLIYSLREIDHGTASFAKRLESGQSVRLFGDVWRQPVWIDTLAEALIRLAENDLTGYFNVAGSQAMTRDSFGRRMLDFWRINAGAVETVSASELGLDVPLDLRLRLERTRQALGLEMPGVDEVLARYAET